MKKHRKQRDESPKPQQKPITAFCKHSIKRQVHQAAQAYLAAGLSIIPISADGTKRPAFDLLPEISVGESGKLKRKWGIFRTRQPTQKEIRGWFEQKHPDQEFGVAIIGGKVSGGLEIIDIDTYDLVEPWSKIVEQKCPGLLERLVRVRTPRPGMHAYYRCPEAGCNQKLARIPVRKPDEEKWRPKTAIEVKAEGGYCLAPPSPAGCHPSGRCYEYVGDKDLTKISKISKEERQVLYDAAQELDLWGEQRRVERQRHRRKGVLPGSNRPGDDYNNRADWSDILKPHGWSLVGDDGDQVDLWCRPGKNFGTSATTNYKDSDLLYVFSTNADPFENETAYTKFHAYALLEHDGDFKAAAIALRKKGYGSQLLRKRKGVRQNPYAGSTFFSPTK